MDTNNTLDLLPIAMTSGLGAHVLHCPGLHANRGFIVRDRGPGQIGLDLFADMLTPRHADSAEPGPGRRDLVPRGHHAGIGGVSPGGNIVSPSGPCAARILEFSDFQHLGMFNRLHLAHLVFGREAAGAATGGAAAVLDLWGYRSQARDGEYQLPACWPRRC
jgi:hypothetical protein